MATQPSTGATHHTRTAASAPARRPRLPLALVAASLAVAALGLTGCAAGTTSSSAGASAVPAPALADGAVVGQPGFGVDGKALDSGGGTIAERTAAAPLSVTPTRSIVVNSDTSVRVANVTKATDELGVVAARYAATIDSQVTSRGDSIPVPVPMTKDETLCVDGGCPAPSPTNGYESSTTTLRLDNDKVDALLRDVAALGTVEASSRSSADVTAEVADVDSRMRNAEASLARVRALLTRATSISDIVALEAELSRRQADLEALQARQRTLADQTAQATVTVRLFDEGAPVTASADTGFLAGLTAGWNAFTGALVVALTVVGAVLPFLLVLVPIALVVWVGVRRSTRTRPVAAAEQA